MYFVPVRKLSKALLVCHVSTSQDSRWAYSRRWLLLFPAVLLCLRLSFYHNNTQKLLFIRQVSNYADAVYNPNKSQMFNTDCPNFDVEITHVDDILKHIDEDIMKEENVTSIATTRKAIGIKQDTEVEDLPYGGIKKDDPILFAVKDNKFPICGSIGKQNGKEKQRNAKKSLTEFLSEVMIGGYYYPNKCRSRHKVAVLVPYRNRQRNLEIFLDHMHPFLIRQQLEYRIFVIEQAGQEEFNRGKLLNIGFTEMMKYNDWHCVVLHDVDFLPLSDRILYTCPIFPRHMLGLVVEKANLTYNQYHILFGGVTALSVKHYKQINGFSNLYWGWGGEDNDMYWRILFARLPMIRYHSSVARYKSSPHDQQPKNSYRYQLLKFAVTRYKTDGLSSLVYKVIWTKYHHLYTHILADVNPMKENITDVYQKMFS